MAWLTEEQFEEEWVTDSATDLPPALVQKCLASAKAKIKTLIKADIFASVEEGSSEDIDAILEAQSLLAARRLLLNRAFRFRNGGIVRVERDENNSVTNQYESSKENEQSRESLLKEALGVLETYYTDEAEIEVEYPPDSLAVPVVTCW